MKRKFFIIIMLALACGAKAQDLKSPDGRFTMHFALNEQGRPTYQLSFEGKEVIKTSALGLELKKEYYNEKNTVFQPLAARHSRRGTDREEVYHQPHR